MPTQNEQRGIYVSAEEKNEMLLKIASDLKAWRERNPDAPTGRLAAPELQARFHVREHRAEGEVCAVLAIAVAVGMALMPIVAGVWTMLCPSHAAQRSSDTSHAAVPPGTAKS